MPRRPRQTGERNGHERDVRERLVPGGGKALFRECAARPADGASGRRRQLYSLVSSISSAMRERADDQARSTERSETASASAVSAVVRPAK